MSRVASRSLEFGGLRSAAPCNLLSEPPGSLVGQSGCAPSKPALSRRKGNAASTNARDTCKMHPRNTGAKHTAQAVGPSRAKAQAARHFC